MPSTLLALLGACPLVAGLSALLAASRMAYDVMRIVGARSAGGCETRQPARATPCVRAGCSP
ncbi:hypothetical protein ACWDR3_41175 [Streptomyces sp. NPDC001002]